MVNRRRWLFGTVISLLTITAAILIIPIQTEISALRALAGPDVLLLDAGHGGIDSGAKGSAGVCEKHINLNISVYIRQMAEADGWKVIMTREDDRGLYLKKDRQSIRSLKTEDLLERKRIIDEKRPLLAVSIHLNSFKQNPGVRGAQTFYPGNGDAGIQEESRRLAETIQKNLVEGLSDGTDRTALSKNDVLLLKKPVVPIVIVECGFLSNPGEEALLNQDTYQRKVAKCIYNGIMEYTGKERKPPLQIIDNRG
ncbi:MAG TPA: N-acetylmuramoyl-L-alanine amidase [Bacillota bacterium]|jgi:N-acetylmuramoyl-L-alanine amidase|nr:N-acetylmuramoyl-L-alanine amidase [Bacillota bacterium]